VKFLMLTGIVIAALASAGVAFAQNGVASSLDIKQAISDLENAAKLAQSTDLPLDQMGQLKSWDKLLVLAEQIKASVLAALRASDSNIGALKVTSEKYQSDPGKAEVLTKRIEALQAQMESLSTLEGKLNKAITNLKDKVAKIRADPEVKQALETEKALQQADAALKKADGAMPDSLK